jgi:GT2 family glycosyltransferase
VLGFIACGSVVRRSAYLEVGGFHARFGIGGEEELLAIDLAMAGWDVAYVPEVVAHHHPSEQRDHDRRRRRQVRNALWVQWLRRPWPVAVARSVQLVRPALADATLRRGLVDAVRGLPWVARDRRRVPPELERNLRLLERQPG